MKHRKHTLSQRAVAREKRARFSVKPLAWAITLVAGGQGLLMPEMVLADQIRTDGRTNTTLEIQGNVTDVRTKTILGSTAYNSFSKFDVHKGNVVNLHVPSKADNLLNLVHSADPSHINGVLNSIKDGGIGGNVYIANTAGVVIGAEGQVNVGALTIVTPTKEVMEGFFGADGTPSQSATQAMLDHTVAISPSGNVTVKGKVNAKSNITIAAGTVNNSGAIQSGAVYASEAPDFSDVVNVADLQTGTRISIENGDIEILAEENIVNTGIIASDGANNLQGGNIHLHAGNDITVAGSAKITASGHGDNSSGGNVIIKAERNATLQDDAKIVANAGDTGDGGFVEFSAKDTVAITGGSLRASAKAGASGTVLIDPATIRWIGSDYDQFTDGTNYVLEADESIVLDNVVLSTRQIAGADTRNAHSSEVSTGNSGNITLRSKNIELKGGTQLLANANNGYTGGTVTLEAHDESVLPSLGWAKAETGINITNSTIKANKVVLEAKSKIDSQFVYDLSGSDRESLDSNASIYTATSDEIGQSLLNLGNTSLQQLGQFFLSLGGVELVVSDVDAKAHINLNSGTVIESATDVVLSAETVTAAGMAKVLPGVLGNQTGTPLGIGALYVRDAAEASTSINSGASITAQNLTVSAHNNASLEGTIAAASNETEDSNFTAVAGSFTRADVNASSTVNVGANLKVGGDVVVSASNVGNFSNEVTSETGSNGRAAAAIAVADNHSSATATLNASIADAGNVSVRAINDVQKDVTVATAKVGGSEIDNVLGAGKKKVENMVGKTGAEKSVEQALFKLIGLGDKTPDIPSSPTQQSFRIGGAIAYNTSVHEATATVGDNSKIHATGDVSVTARIRAENMKTAAHAAAASTSSERPQASDTSRMGYSVGLALGDYTHDVLAKIGSAAEITAQRIGVSADTIIPIRDSLLFGSDGSVNAWTRWTGLSSITDALSTLTSLTDVFNGEASSSASSDGSDGSIGLSGGVNWLTYNDSAQAVIDSNAKLNVTGSQTGAWQQDVVVEEAVPTYVKGVLVSTKAEVSESFKFAAPVSITAAHDASLLFLTGKLGLASSGEKALGASLGMVEMHNTTEAIVREGVTIRGVTETASGTVAGQRTWAQSASHAAENVVVNASSDVRVVSIAENAGMGTSYGANGVYSQMTQSSATHALVDDEARIHAKNFQVLAQSSPVLFSIAGGLNYSGGVSVGVGVAINDIGGDTRAEIADNDTWSLDGSPRVSQVSLSTDQIKVPELMVESRTSGHMEAIAVTGALSSNSPDEDGQIGTLTALKDKWNGVLDKAGNWVDLEKAAGPNPSQAKAPPQKPDIGLSGAGSLAMNFTDITTLAKVDGVTIDQSHAGNPSLQPTLTVRAVQDSDIVAATGAAAITRSNPSAAQSKSAAISGSIAVNSIGNATKAWLKNTIVNGAHDLYVQALAGGEQLAVAIGMAVDLSSASKSFSMVGSASLTLAQTDDNDETKNKTEAVVEDSTITGEAGSGRNMEVTAYNRTYIGTGGGSLTVSAGSSSATGASVGGAVSWADVRNNALAGVYGSSITQLDSLDVRAYNATEIGSGAAMLTAAPTAAGVDSFAGSLVVNQIVNNTTAEIDNSSNINVSGNVNVIAADRGADGALESIIDPDGGRNNTAKGLDYCGESAGGATPSGNCIVAVAGTVQAGRGANYGVSVAYNSIENNLTARINQSTVAAGAIDVKAKSDTSILGIGFGVGLSTDKFSGAGSISMADIDSNVQAIVSGSATTLTAPIINVAASDDSSINTLAGQVNVALKNSSVGAAITYNNIGNDIKAVVDGATLNVSNALDVHAREDAEIMSLAAAGGFAKDTNVSVSLAISFIDNAVESAIKNSTVRDGASGQNTVKVRAEDTATIKSLAGSVGVGQQAGAGAALALNRIGGGVSALIHNSTIEAAQLLNVLADTAHVLWSMAAAVGAGRDGYAGSLAINDIGESSFYGDEQNIVLAEISGSTVKNGNGTDIKVHAKDDSDIRSVTGGAAIGVNSSAVGGAIGENRIHTNVTARVNNSSLQHSKSVTLESFNDASIKTLSASGAFTSGVAVSGSVSANEIGNNTKSELKDSEITGSTANVVVSASDTATIDALAGGAAFAGSGAAGVAIAANRIDSTTTANVSGKKNDGYLVKNMQVLADSLATIQALSVSLAAAGGSAGAGNIAINLLGSDTKAFIDKGAVVVAQNNVGVLAESDDRISIASGSAGIALGGALGVGASMTVNSINGETVAYIGDAPDDYSGPATSVTALAKDSADVLRVNDGTLTVGVDLAKQVDLEQYNKLVLADSRNKVNVNGLAVNASSTEQIENIGTNVAGASGVAVGLIESTSVTAGSTQAYILNANINSNNGGAGAKQQVSVTADNITYDNSFVGNVAVSKGGSVGIGADVHSVSRLTRAYSAGGSITARDAVSVSARSLQGISSVTVGAAAGIVGGAGTLSLSLFDNTTEAFIKATEVQTKDLTVSADNDNNMYQVGGVLAGGLAGGVGGTFVVASSDSTTTAYIEDATGRQAIEASGGVNVTADNNTDINHVAVTVAGGAAGVAGMATVNLITDKTNAYVKNSEIGSTAAKASAIKISANNDLAIDSKAGALGVGFSAVGVGAGASVNIVKAQTVAAVNNSDLYASGQTQVTAESLQAIDATAMTAGIGLTSGIGGAAIVTLVGDDVRDEGADEVSGTLTAVNNMANGDRFSQYDTGGATDLLTAADRDSINNATQRSVTDVSSSAGGYTFRTAAEVTGSSNISAGSVLVDAKNKTDTESMVGGFGVGKLGLGGGVAVSNIKANVAATVAATSRLNSTGSIAINALADNNHGKTVDILALAGGAGLVGLGAAVAYADISNHVDASLAGGASSGGAITVTAADNTDASADAKGATAGAFAAGVVISDAEKTSSVNAVIGGAVNASSASVAASNAGAISAVSQSAAGGITAAGNGAVSQAKQQVNVNAYSVNGTSFNLGAGELKVTASTTPQVSARADGVSVSGGYNIGVSVANATIKDKVNAYLGASNTVNAGSLQVKAQQLRNADADAAKATAFAAGGGLLVGLSATISDVLSDIDLSSYVGNNSTLNVANLTDIQAVIDSKQYASVDGYNGGLVAVGFNDATASSDTNVQAYLGSGVLFTNASGNLTVYAGGKDENNADATSGAGGLVSGAGANANTSTTSVTKAYIGDATATAPQSLSVKNLTLTADHESRFNATVDSINASLVGGSGAYASNDVNSTVQAALGSNLNITAKKVDVNANNRVTKQQLSHNNVESGSGGVFDMPATRSKSNVTLDTDVSVGNDSHIVSLLPGEAALGHIAFNALNDIYLYDSAKLDSGGAIAIANAESELYVDKSDADITVGSGTVIDSDNTITFNSKTDAEIISKVDTKTYGLAGAAQGSSVSSINTSNNITLNGARLVSLKDVVLNAGYDNNLNVDAETRLWNKTAIPMSTSPDADARVTQSNIITVHGYSPSGGVLPATNNPDPLAVKAQTAAIASKGDVHLKAGHGQVALRGFGRGTDLYRQLIADAASLFGADISLDTTGGSTSNKSGAGVVVSGQVFAGTHWQQLLHIYADANGNPTDVKPLSDGWDTTAISLTGEHSLDRYYAKRIAALESLYQEFKDSNPDAANGYLADKQLLEAKQAQSAGVSVRFYEIGKQITANSSNIHVYGDTLTGAGELIAPGNTKIEIVNDSKHFLRVNDLKNGAPTLFIDDELGGVVNFNGVSVSDSNSISNANSNGVISKVSVNDRSNSGDPEINLINTFEYAVTGNGYVNPEVHIDGDIANRRGTIHVASTGSIEVGGNLNGKTIDIRSKGDFVKLFEEGFTHIGGDDTLNLFTDPNGNGIVEAGECPVTLSDGKCFVSRDASGNFITGNTLYTDDMYHEYLALQAYRPNADFVPVDRDGFTQTDQWTDSGSYHEPGYVPGSTIAGGNVFISAEKLNINGLIQSGFADYKIEISQAKADEIVKAKGQWLQLDNNQDEFFAPKARWNEETNSIELSSIQVGGGFIQLYGDIFSTGNGQLKVMDGYGHIEVNNASDKALTLNKLDTGLGAAGKIQITDTGNKNAQGNSLVTTIILEDSNGDGIRDRTVSSSQYENTSDSLRATFTSNNNKTGTYNTRQGRRLNWLNVQSYDLTYVGSYETSCLWGCNWGLGDSLSLDAGKTSKSSSSSVYAARTGGMPPNGEVLSQEANWSPGDAVPDYRMDMTKTTSGVTVTALPTETWWTDTCFLGICVDDKEHIKTSVEYKWKETFNFNHSLNASKGVNVEFIGHDSGALKVSSSADLNLSNVLRNLTGETTVSGANINSVSPNAQIIASDLVLAATDSIGSVAEPLKIDLQADGAITATAGHNIALWEQSGILNIDKVYGGSNAADRVWLRADGDILNGAASGVDAVRGGNIDLLSDNGSVGHENKAMRIDTTSSDGDVSVQADNDIFLTESNGDLRIESITALAGDVSLTALSGNFIDVDAQATVDVETQKALLDVAARAGLQGAAAQVSADSSIRAYNLARQTEYQQYWQMRQLQRTADGSYQAASYDPNYSYQVTEADQLAFASRPASELQQYSERQTALYHDVYQRLNPTGTGDVAYDANYRYDVQTMDSALYASLTEGYSWSDGEIFNRIGAGIFKDTPDTEVMIEVANVSGRNITLNAANGSIGRQSGSIVINTANPNAWTEAERLALVAADRSDVNIDWDAKTITIIQKDDIDISMSAGDVLEAHARDGVYIGSEQDISVARVDASGANAEVRIKTSGSLLSAAANGVAAVSGHNLTLEAGSGNLGSFNNAFVVEQTAGGALVARAKNDLYVSNISGDLLIDQVYAGGLAKLTSVGAIKEAPSIAYPTGDLQTDIQANRISLTAGTTIGSADASGLGYLDVATTLGGRLDAVAPYGVYVYSSGGMLGLGDIAASHGEVVIDTFADGLTILGDVVSRDSVSFNVGGGILFGEESSLTSIFGDIRLRANGYLLEEDSAADAPRTSMKMQGDAAISTPKGAIKLSGKYDLLVGNLTALNGIALSSDSGVVANGANIPVNITSLAGNVGVSGKGIDLRGITAAGGVTLQAGKQGINISDMLDAGGEVSANTTGNINIHQLVSVAGDATLTAAGDIALDGAAVAQSLSLQAGSAKSAGDVTAGALYVGENLAINSSGVLQVSDLLHSAADATLSANAIKLQNLHSGGRADLAAGAGGIVVAGALAAEQDVAVNSAGDIAINQLNSAQGGADIIATGNVALDQTAVTGNLAVNGAAVSLGRASSGAQATITGGAGGVTVLDRLLAAGNGAVTAVGDIAIHTLSSLNGDAVVASSGGDIAIAQLLAERGDASVLASVGDALVETLAVAGDFGATAVNVALDNGTVGGDLAVNASSGNAELGVLQVVNTATVTASDDVNVQSLATAQGAINLSGAGIAVHDLLSGADTSLNAGANGLQITGLLDSKRDVTLLSDAAIGLNRVKSETGDIHMTAAGAITNRNLNNDINIDARNITLLSQNSTLGEPGVRLVGRATGLYDLKAATGIYFEDRSAVFNGSVNSTSGLVDLFVAGTGGTAGGNQLVASARAGYSAPAAGTAVHLASLTGPVINFSAGSLVVDWVDGGQVNLTATDVGGSISIGQAQVSESLSITADHINLPYVEYAGSSGTLPIYLHGASSQRAKETSVYIAPTGNPHVVFDALATNQADIHADVSRVSFIDAVVGRLATFSSKYFKVAVDNVNKILHRADLQLYTQTTPFNLTFYPEYKFELNYALGGDYRWNGASIINYDQRFIVNAFSTENSATRFAPKLLTLNKPLPGSEWDGLLGNVGNAGQSPALWLDPALVSGGSCITGAQDCSESALALQFVN